MRRSNDTILLAIGAISICIIIACCILLAIFYRQSPIQPTPTALDIPAIIALTSNAALASTQAAYTLTPVSTNTPLATFTLPPTLTQPPNLLATLAAVPTNTPLLILPTTASSQSGQCDCSGDLYNCPGFASRDQAQACFNHCHSLGYDDPSRLDRDDDLLACEDTDY